MAVNIDCFMLIKLLFCIVLNKKFKSIVCLIIIVNIIFSEYFKYYFTIIMRQTIGRSSLYRYGCGCEHKHVEFFKIENIRITNKSCKRHTCIESVRNYRY